MKTKQCRPVGLYPLLFPGHLFIIIVQITTAGVVSSVALFPWIDNSAPKYTFWVVPWKWRELILLTDKVYVCYNNINK